MVMSGILRATIICLVFSAAALCQIRPLEQGKVVERAIAPGEIHIYALDVPGDRMVRLFFRQVLPFPATVRLICDGERVLADRTSRQNILLSALAPGPGSCRVEFSAGKSGASTPGHYRISAVQIREERPQDPALLEADAMYTEYRRVAAASSEQAAAKLDSAANLYQQLGEIDFQGWSLLLAGQYWVRLSDYNRAAERYTRASAAFEKAGDPVGRANALDFLGDISEVLRDYPKAIETASKELSLARAEHLPELEAAALSILGRAYSALGDKQLALDDFQQAITIARSIGDRTRESAALRAAASLYNSLGDYEKALGLYQDVLKIERARGQPLNEAAALSNIGSSYASLKQTAAAIQYFEQAIALFRSTGGGRPALATTLGDCGQAYLAMHEPSKAVPLLEEALTISRETSNRWSESYALMNIARSRAGTSDSQGTAGLLADALRIAQQIDDPQLQSIILFEKARVERARGNLEPARENVAGAIKLVESLRKRVAVPDLKSSLVASISDYYELHVDVLMGLYRQSGSVTRLEEARQAAESARARNLLDVLGSAGIHTNGAPDPDASANEQKLRRQLSGLAAKRTDLQRNRTPVAKLAAIDRQIEDSWTEYQSAKSKVMAADPLALAAAESGALDLAAIQKEGLDADTVLLEYSLGETRSHLWIVSPNELRAFDLAPRGEVEAAARAFWNAVKSGADPGSMAVSATRLSQMILGPAAEFLANKRLLIVGDGALQFVPFAALADPAQSKQYRPLIQAHEVIQEPSGNALVMLRRGAIEHKTAPRSLAIFADPVFEANDPRIHSLQSARPDDAPQPAFLTRASELRLTRLPSTRHEGRSIASLLPESQRWLALDFDASRAAIASSGINQYRILHFATHGVIETVHPELSALALSMYDSRGHPQDGFLRLYEIYNLNLQADLVVLSACETALGRDVRGEGLIGLARGFMHAGAPRVVASLWKVDDEASSELMRLFYAAMLGPRCKPPAAALREAQLAIASQERWRAPYYWAAFGLQGEWK
jgi:CHAT domain-containing protein/tetratricopeptide (TPR) repeat protein